MQVGGLPLLPLLGIVSLNEDVVSLDEGIVSLNEDVVSLDEGIVSLDEGIVSLDEGLYGGEIAPTIGLGAPSASYTGTQLLSDHATERMQ